MFFNFNGIISLCLLSFPIVFLINKINSVKLNNALFMYFFLMAPYFIRRSISSFIVDVVILIIIYLIIHLFNQINSKNDNSYLRWCNNDEKLWKLLNFGFI